MASVESQRSAVDARGFSPDRGDHLFHRVGQRADRRQQRDHRPSFRHAERPHAGFVEIMPGDGAPPWRRLDLIRMDRAFCDAMRREMARGSEQARGPAATSAAARAAHRFDPAPLRSGATSPAELCAEIGDDERIWWDGH